MNAIIHDKTVLRISRILNTPISRGIDKSINICLDKIDKSQNFKKRGEKNEQ